MDAYEYILDSLIEDSYEDSMRVQDWLDEQEGFPERIGAAFTQLRYGHPDAALTILENLRKSFNEWVEPKLEDKASDRYIDQAIEARYDRG